MLATIPADLAQFYGFIIRVAQELAYIYGWKEELTSTSDYDVGTQSQLVIFIGVMSGVAAANKVVAKLFGQAMNSVAEKVAAKALTKTWYFPIAKKIANLLGQRMVKSTFGAAVGKAMPVLGGVISGGLTLATFKPMCHRLKDQMSSLAHMTPEEFSIYEASLVIDTDEAFPVSDTVVPALLVVDTNYWICACGAQNKSTFCSECGSSKPAGIPQYKCDKCGWEPDDRTNPPKFCPECCDPFDDGILSSKGGKPMAHRICFLAERNNSHAYREIEVEFQFFSGFSVAQKQRSIKSTV